jgi:hypothetical protein
MTNPSESASYRTRWASQTHHTVPVDNMADMEKQLISEHLGEGWICENKSVDTIIFSIHLDDGRKWTREYNKKTCRFVNQRFYAVGFIASTMLEKKEPLDWPNGVFGE